LRLSDAFSLTTSKGDHDGRRGACRSIIQALQRGNVAAIPTAAAVIVARPPRRLLIQCNNGAGKSTLPQKSTLLKITDCGELQCRFATLAQSLVKVSRGMTERRYRRRFTSNLHAKSFSRNDTTSIRYQY
jgi:hypothetical protein